MLVTGLLFLRSLRFVTADHSLAGILSSFASAHLAPRHWFFKADLFIDGEKASENLMDIVRSTLTANPGNSVIGFKDNSSAIRWASGWADGQAGRQGSPGGWLAGRLPVWLPNKCSCLPKLISYAVLGVAL